MGEAPVATTLCRAESGGRGTRKRRLSKRFVNCRWVFNNIRVGELLVDCRPRDQFARSTIVGAISIAPPLSSGVQSLQSVESALAEDKDGQAAALLLAKRSLRDIVLFGEMDDLRDASSWMYRLEQMLLEDGRAASVKTMCDAFSTFETRYPFYTTAGVIDAGVLQSGANQVTYPNEIVEDFLYLGNMWQAGCKQVIDHLHITHVVNATLDVGNVFEADGVKYHEVKLRDAPDADIAQFFDSTFAFISEAKRSCDAQGRPCRVLVHCTQGISRSATLVIMYVMRAYDWSLAQAFNFTRSGRGVVMPNDGFVRALMAEERRLHHDKFSVTEADVDTLLSGDLPNRAATIETVASSAVLSASGSEHLVACSLTGVDRGRCALM